MPSSWSKYRDVINEFNTSLQDQITPPAGKKLVDEDEGDEEDSGYKGLETPRHYKKNVLRKTRLNFSAGDELSRSTSASLGLDVNYEEFLQNYLPIIISIIFMCSIFFMVFMGNHSSYSNGKYESLKYGAERRGGGLVILDPETGMLLGGKKAAIKYYYDVKYRAYGEYNEITPEEIENIEVQLKNPNLATKDL